MAPRFPVKKTKKNAPFAGARGFHNQKVRMPQEWRSACRRLSGQAILAKNRLPA
jgi:hypothetical protein